MTPSPSPKRIQLRRTRGWRKPEGAVVVARPSKWGNPWRVSTGCQAGGFSAAITVAMFEQDLRRALDHPWSQQHDIAFRIMAESLSELSGHDLACWCPLDQPCHGDVLLELANSPSPAVREEAP